MTKPIATTRPARNGRVGHFIFIKKPCIYVQFLHIAVGSEEASCCAAKNSIGARRGFSVGANVNAPTRAAGKKDQVVGEDPKIVSGDLVKKRKKSKERRHEMPVSITTKLFASYGREHKKSGKLFWPFPPPPPPH